MLLQTEYQEKQSLRTLLDRLPGTKHLINHQRSQPYVSSYEDHNILLLVAPPEEALILSKDRHLQDFLIEGYQKGPVRHRLII